MTEEEQQAARVRLAHLKEQLEALRAYGNGNDERAVACRREIADIEAELAAAEKPSPRPRRGHRKPRED